VKATGKKSIILPNGLKLFEAWHVPELYGNFISLSQLKRLKPTFADGTFRFKSDGKNYTALSIGGLYPIQKSRRRYATEGVPLARWHERLGHLNLNDTKAIVRKVGLAISNQKEKFCEGC
jgi:hypothetical protein